MLLRSIRSRLLALVVATVIPFTVLVGMGLWSQWESDQAAAIQQAIGEARVLAAQIDDHIGNVENLLTGLSEAVSADSRDVEANDALLRRVRGQLPEGPPREWTGACMVPEPRLAAEGANFHNWPFASECLDSHCFWGLSRTPVSLIRPSPTA